MDLSSLDKLTGPHLHLLADEPAKASEKIVYPLLGSGKVVRPVRGQKMRVMQGVYDEFAAALQFPDYFGENWAAFDECLTDLDWLGYDVPGYVVIVRHTSQLLADEDQQAFDELLGLLDEAGEEWAQPVQDGEWWDRPGRPFHVVLQESAEAGEAILTRLRMSGTPLGEIWRADD
ncbi:MAG: hypothetical protein GEV07_04655 [Streptosporangiales bacterium]|nr:hypothetical protein [Streptosporangiales bacterium]